MRRAPLVLPRPRRRRLRPAVPDSACTVRLLQLHRHNGYSAKLNFVGLHNYTGTSPTRRCSSLGFTLVYAVATTLVITVLAIPLAVVLNRSFVGRNLVRSVFFFPAVPSVAILGLVWTFILNPLGLRGAELRAPLPLGIGPVPWLSDNTLARLSVVAVAVWAATGWHAHPLPGLSPVDPRRVLRGRHDRRSRRLRSSATSRCRC